MTILSATKSLYEVLDLTPVAPPEAVRKAYKRLALETHPDKHAPDATEEEREAGEARFREVHAAFEVLSDPSKRRQYDIGFNFLRRAERQAEVSAKIARERKAWEAEQQRRREERLRRLREQQQAREERRRASAERMQQEKAEAQSSYEKRRTHDEELIRSYQQNQQMLLQSALARVEKLKALEEDLKRRLGAEMGRSTSRMAIQMPLAAARVVQVKQPEEFLEELRQQNPEWEARRQAALQRKAERIQSQASQDSTNSEDSSSMNGVPASSTSSVDLPSATGEDSSSNVEDSASTHIEDSASTHSKDSSSIHNEESLSVCSNQPAAINEDSCSDISDAETVVS